MATENDTIVEIASKLKGNKHVFYWHRKGRRFDITFIVQEMIDGILYGDYIDDLYWKWKEEMGYSDDVNKLINYFRKNGVWCELERK